MASQSETPNAQAQATEQTSPTKAPNTRSATAKGKSIVLWLLALPLFLFARLGSLLILLLGLLIVTLVWLLGTSHGAGTLIHAANEFAPVQIHSEKVEGRLLGDLRLLNTELIIPAAEGAATTTPTTITAAQLRLNWQPAALLKLKVLLYDVELRGVHAQIVAGPEKEQSNEPFELPEKIELPVQIELQRLVADDIQWTLINPAQPKQAAAQRLGHAEIGLLQWDDGLSIAQLKVRDFHAADAQVNAAIEQLQLAASAPYQHAASLNWSVQLPDQPKLAGSGRLVGDIEKITLQQQLAAPLNSELSASVTTPLGQLRWQLKSSLNGLRLGHWLEAQQAPLKGQIVASGDLESYQADIQIQSTVVVSTAVKAAKNDKEIKPAPAPKKLPAELKLTLSGDLHQATLPTLSIRLGEALISGNANAAWPQADGSGKLAAQAQLRVEKLNPGLLAPDWPGLLATNLTANVSMPAGPTKTGPRPSVEIEMSKLSGKLRGYPIGGAMLVRLNPKGELTIEKMNLRSGQSVLTLNGQIRGLLADQNNAIAVEKLTSQLQLQLNAADLAELLPNARGQLLLKASTKGRLLEPAVVAELQGKTIAIQGNQVETLTLNANWPGGTQVGQLALSATGIKAADQVIDAVKLKANGNIEQHTAELTVDSATANLALAAAGSFANETWLGNLNQLNIRAIDLDGWQLQAPMPLKVTADSVQLGRSCLIAAAGPAKTESDQRSVCVDANISNSKGGPFAVSIDNLKAGYLEPLLPPQLLIDTALSGQLQGQLKADKSLLADARFTLAAGSIQQRGETDPAAVSRFEFAEGQLVAKLDSVQATANLNLPLTANNPGSVEANLNYQLNSQQLDARVNGGLDNLDKLRVFTDAVSELDGKLSWDLRAQGPASEPVLTGAFKLSNGRAVIPEPGLVLEKINIEATGDPSGALQLNGGLLSGGGKLTVNGQLQLVENGLTGKIQLKGKGFQAINTPDAQVWISPDLNLTISEEAYKLRGSLTIPEASITPKKLPESQGGIGVSDDVVIIEDESAISAANPDGVAASDSKVDAEVKLQLGDKVTFSGFGLEAKLEGGLLLIEKPGQVTRGSGELQLAEGRYQALGQDLSISNGRLIFSGGPIDQPGVDMRATRTSDDGTIAGLLVRGPVSNPEFSVYSVPSKPDDVALSYLITGRPPESQSQADKKASSAAIAALGARGGNFLAQRLGSRLGIEDIKFEAGESLEQSTLTIGKYLTPKLYLSYGVGVFEPSSTIRMRYTLSKKWRLETESGTEVGADIFYTIER